MATKIPMPKWSMLFFLLVGIQKVPSKITNILVKKLVFHILVCSYLTCPYFGGQTIKPFYLILRGTEDSTFIHVSSRDLGAVWFHA